MIFAIGGDSGGGATVERLSDLPAADDAGRAPPSIEAAVGFGVAAGGAADDFPRAEAALGVPVGRAVDDSPSLDEARDVAAGFPGAAPGAAFPRVAAALGAVTAAAPAEGEPLWAEAGRGAPGAEEAAGALARPVATADWSSAA
ncbi:hypothetical protein [Actinoplanes sp. ATCC 53533]|uniref:hypothetical protein n=1 Tax=Actinoplanes sp. ATCC 53533 TaxID=1288362 RepID=UPI000F77DF4D|nr:hypothetical protein [Actinoplanes sp. ATCC 53533]